jgi:hypothetical protein
MIFAPVIDALGLPPDARVDQRVPKKLLLDQGVPTAADKRQIQDGIEDIHWIAALKPTNIGVPDYRDAVREYLEIAILTVTFRQAAKPARLIELIHRAIPYPVVLLSGQSGTVSLSLAHKRWSQGEAGKVVLDKGYPQITQINTDKSQENHLRTSALSADVMSTFLASLALSTLPAADLFTLYQAWIDRLTGLEASSITGSFIPLTSAEHSTTLRDGLANHARLQYELTTLRKLAAKEKQLNRRVELNMTIKRLEAELAELKTTL